MPSSERSGGERAFEGRAGGGGRDGATEAFLEVGRSNLFDASFRRLSPEQRNDLLRAARCALRAARPRNRVPETAPVVLERAGVGADLVAALRSLADPHGAAVRRDGPRSGAGP